MINYITTVGLTLCNDLKLNNRILNDNKVLAKELGGFCEQFAITNEKLSAPSNRIKKYKKKKNKSYEKPFKTSYSKYKRMKRNKNEVKPYKDKYTKMKCFKCGQLGHSARFCKIKEKINNLHIDQEFEDLNQDQDLGGYSQDPFSLVG